MTLFLIIINKSSYPLHLQKGLKLFPAKNYWFWKVLHKVHKVVRQNRTFWRTNIYINEYFGAIPNLSEALPPKLVSISNYIIKWNLSHKVTCMTEIWKWQNLNLAPDPLRNESFTQKKKKMTGKRSFINIFLPSKWFVDNKVKNGRIGIEW